jgi:hypothetical protein
VLDGGKDHPSSSNRSLAFRVTHLAAILLPAILGELRPIAALAKTIPPLKEKVRWAVLL